MRTGQQERQPAEAVKTIAENDAVESVSTTRLSVFMPGAGDILPFETVLPRPRFRLSLA